MKQLVTQSGEELTEIITDHMTTCYLKLAGKGLLPEVDSNLRGMITAYETVLHSLGRHAILEIKTKIREVSLNES